MLPSPALIFIPGSWHKPICYRKIIQLLEEKHQHRCVSLTLPSTQNNPAATFKDDIDVVRKAITDEVSQGHDVVVIAHSYGGMVGNSAIKGFTRDQVAGKTSAPVDSIETTPHDAARSNDAATGHVVGLVLIASGFTFTGLAFMDPFFGRPPPSWRVNKDTGYAELVAPPQEMFYHDLAEDEAKYWTLQLTTQSLKSLFEGGEHAYAGWQDLPVWYIGTVEDKGLPVVIQRMQIGMAREMGCHVEHRELMTSHSPFLSRPEVTAQIIVQSVEAFTQRDLGAGLESSTPGKGEISVPSVRFSQPLSWYRFGLPLFFGCAIGRCILIFDGFKRLWLSGARS